MRAALLTIAAATLLGCSPRPAPATAANDGAAASQAAATCGDILSRLGRKPPVARFTGCQSFPDRQGAPLRATYDVAGRDAVAVERDLIRTTGLAPLKRSCCQWDSAPAGFTDDRGGQYTIAMVSEETDVTRRADWNRIGTFRVTVEMLTDEI